MLNDLASVMFDEAALAAKCREMGQQLTRDYAGKDLLVVGILKGSVMFFADLVRQINVPLNIDFMVASSYGSGTETSGSVKIKKDLDVDIKGRHVLLVEDIIDSGRTLSYLMDILGKRNPRSLRLCTLLDKPERRVTPVEVDYTCFNIPDEFVVGYGLDYAQKYRNLPFIGIVEFVDD